MATYVVATLVVRDLGPVQDYFKHIAGVLPRHGGEVVVSKPVKETVEGESAPDTRVTILKFPDEASARAYINTPEYQAGKKARQSGSSMTMHILSE